MKHSGDKNQLGFTLVELIVSMAVISLIVVGILGLLASLVSSARYSKEKAAALGLATSKMEYLKSLPYDALAVSGGSIVAAAYLPATETQTLDGFTYTVKTDIDYVDEAFDGCAAYPSTELAQQYCRNYPAPNGSPTDTNPKDYKLITVSVFLGTTAKQLSSVSSYVAARVAETSSTTGALFLRVVDGAGMPVAGANVSVTNSTVSPPVNQTDNTDINGVAIFYDLKPDTVNYDYVVSVSKTGYSSLTTIPPTTHIPYYANQQIYAQQSAQLTMIIDKQPANGLLVYATTPQGDPLPNLKLAIKGGYKKYNSTTDTSYYFDTTTPTDTRPATDASGRVGFSGIVPGQYIFCGDTGSAGCQVGSTTYYLVAAVPTLGSNAYSPVTVPVDVAGLPTVNYGGKDYTQSVQLILSTSSSFPRVQALLPDDIALSSANLTAYPFSLKGINLPCSSTPAACATTVKVLASSGTYPAECTGTVSGLQLDCIVDVSGIAAGLTQLEVTSSGQTYVSPLSVYGGSFNVVP